MFNIFFSMFQCFFQKILNIEMKGKVIRVSHFSDYSAQILAPYLLEHITKAHYQLVVCFKELTTTFIMRLI
uniref:Uncharacterized protein n=1 Tax=Colobus angolensis palliatus TaxID=336983 RepID=A0A2K5IX15_COLAP